MAHSRRRQRSLPDHSDRHALSSMDQLTMQYMVRSGMESSTESDSEISPRWSDTSTMGCASSAPESGTSRRATVTHKLAARHGCNSLFLDPYDGSSENSDESHIDVGASSRQTRQQKKKTRLLSRRKRFFLHEPASVSPREEVKRGMRNSATKQQLLDAGIAFESEAELWLCELAALSYESDEEGCGNLTEERTNKSPTHTQTMDVEQPLDDSGLQATRSSSPHTPVKESPPQVRDSSSERSPNSCNLRSFFKRKLGMPGAEEAVGLSQNKRQCVMSMEDEQEGKNSASEAC
ncbi:uncharacterized protein LOC103376502 [Stegastes partitus]|uniref:Uncharacterized protein LOC103376502 n=1 Tax=Stegastes partitus TaxID=144197 RepID=A0A9Y4U4P6_9TELE|nr:PREDICTED: uncharacterized protein LOC103376502 [Stegastes partitus]